MREMRELKSEIKNVVDKELLRANKEHNPKFVDEMHRYGVIAGEYKELKNELKWLERDFSRYELFELLIKEMPEIIESIEKMRVRALNLAAETIQFIAMCEKALAGIYEDMKKEGIIND